ncbi:PASTA domain-containing protein [Streptomyces sp. Marseille-Q5077]|uniref:PASTA domain-containing protein n=1 Tax=Streptomyces sp. Marseille-Q5077 TaxID=3418995 RepID=UPI003CFCA8A1
MTTFGTDSQLTVARTVLDLTSNTVSDARKLLTDHDLRLGDTTGAESGAESGTAVGQRVASGGEVEPGTTVDIKIAKAAATVWIPTGIVGKTLAAVQDELGALRLHLSVTTGYPQASDAVVTFSIPGSGSEVREGSTVVVVTRTRLASRENGATAGDTATTPAVSEDPSIPKLPSLTGWAVGHESRGARLRTAMPAGPPTPMRRASLSRRAVMASTGAAVTSVWRSSAVVGSQK